MRAVTKIDLQYQNTFSTFILCGRARRLEVKTRMFPIGTFLAFRVPIFSV